MKTSRGEAWFITMRVAGALHGRLCCTYQRGVLIFFFLLHPHLTIHMSSFRFFVRWLQDVSPPHSWCEFMGRGKNLVFIFEFHSQFPHIALRTFSVAYPLPTGPSLLSCACTDIFAIEFLGALTAASWNLPHPNL